MCGSGAGKRDGDVAAMHDEEANVLRLGWMMSAGVEIYLY